MKWKTIIREALLIVLASVVVSGAVYGIRPDKIRSDKIRPAHTKITGIGPRTAGEDNRVNDNTDIREISLDEARKWFDTADAVFVDARHELDFSAGHIRGARHLAVDAQERWLDAFLAETAPETMIITYCDGEDCHLAAEMARLMIFNGFTQVHYLRNGWTRWREQGFPTETGMVPK